MRRAALALLLGFMVSAGLLASDDGAATRAIVVEDSVPKTAGPGAFLVGADNGGAIVVAGPFCDQMDIICDARCAKLGGVFTCVGGTTGFCSVSNCSGVF
jgi:hypothetical protein